jgi:hypothetical protein
MKVDLNNRNLTRNYKNIRLNEEGSRNEKNNWKESIWHRSIGVYSR